MFSLIITIISIALVAALAIATIYYGGSAFTQGNAKSSASTLTAQAQQIMGAVTLYRNDGNNTTGLAVADLAPTYLQSVPAMPAAVVDTDVWSLGAGANSASINVVSLDVCKQVNKSIGEGESVVVSSVRQYSCTGAADCSVATPCVFTYNG